MAKTFYTIDDLYSFCKENHFEKFSSAEKGAPLIVQSLGTFESSEATTDGLMSVKLKSCHTGKNRNKSGISDETMDLYKYSFMGKPILGAIYKTDTGEYEFRGHDMELIENGDDVEINYIEQPIGVISQTVEPHLQYDENMDKNYLMVEGTIFTDYSKAGEILERRKTCKCSVEIAVEEMSYDCKEDYLSIDKFHFCGVTILGYQQDGVTEIQEGMEGSKITIDDFSESNSMFATNVDYTQKLVETLEKLNSTLSSFQNTNIQKKGGTKMDDFENTAVEEEEVEASEDSAEEVIEETTNEETSTSENNEVVETEACGGKKKKCSEDGESEYNDEPVATEEEACGGKKKKCSEDDESEDKDKDAEITEQEACGGKKRKKCSINEIGDVTLEYELSHDDIRSGLYGLLAAESEEGYGWSWIIEVFDSKFIYQDYEENKYYRRGYTVDGDNVALADNKTEVFNEWLSQSEKDALDALKQDYSSLKAFKNNYDADKLKAQKDEIFSRAEYSVLAEDEDFKTLITDAEKYSVEECETKADVIFARYCKSHSEFAVKDETNKVPKVIGVSFNKKDAKKSPYGNLFSK